MTKIFVFGSNLAGRHGKGAALHAKLNYGAIQFVPSGRTGNSYAIPTKDSNLKTLPLSQINEYVKEFIQYANDHPNLEFQVTRVGCGLAGYNNEQIAPMFIGAPLNCFFEQEWYNIICRFKKDI